MQIITKQQLQRLPTTKVLDELMELYELNYINLRRLIPSPIALEQHAVSSSTGHLNLHYQLLEQCKYTSTFQLTYHFSIGMEKRIEPDLNIRLYHDARLAEVISGVLNREYFKLGEKNAIKNNFDALYSKWRLNRFLYKWLNFCIKQGHKFGEYKSSENRAVI